MNHHIPEEYGGMGLGLLDASIIVEELAWGCSGITTAMVGNSLASAPLIVGGSHELKAKYLGRLAEEPLMAAYAVSEPGAGSDVAGLSTKAEKKGDEWVINGSKLWITNAGVANWIMVLARTDKNADAGRAFTAFIVDADTPGVQVDTKKLDNMGQRASDTRGITFENVVVKDSNRIGEVGQGFKLAMKAFDITRPEVAIVGVGLAQRALDESMRYASERKAFSKPIGSFQMVQQMISDMVVGVETSRLMVYKACSEYDIGNKNTYYASIAKLYASELAKKCTSDALQIFGGMGYNKDTGIEKLVRDSYILTIYEGTSQIQRLIIMKELMNRMH